MCGINGGWTRAALAAEVVRKSLDAMAHRGPDDSGVFVAGPVFLGNRRLSIIDLQGGHQPVSNEDGSVVVVLNGEIYNYLELIPELLSKGHRFKTRSDTEVLVHLYEEHGTDMCRHLRGMFAFALWDAGKQNLFVARDRFGKKPLYYTRVPDGMVFASELKALKELARACGDSWSIRTQSIYDYLSLGVVPQPETVFREVYVLPPASWMRFDGETLHMEEYWRLEYEPKASLSYENAQHRVRELIRDAVRLRLRADTPLGVFLSGGLDSSVVAYEAAQEVQGSLETFTVSVGDERYDESAVARLTARHLGVRHTVLPLKVSPVNELEQLVKLYDQPYSDSSAIPSLAVSRLARQHVKVVLNGDGGDELFAGYRRYVAVRYADRLAHLPIHVLRRFAGFMEMALGQRLRRTPLALLARFLRGFTLTRGERYLVWTMDMLREPEKKRVWIGGPMRPTEEWIESRLPTGLSQLDTQMLGDIRIILLNALLVKMDMATMGASIEGRSPLLDHVLAEFAARLPDDYKIRHGRTKALVRDAYSGLLPAAVICGAKLGFEVPLLSWLQNELRPVLMDTVGTGTALVRSYLDGAFIDDLLAGKGMENGNWAEMTYTVLMLELWLRDAT
jgi:asparagine synthase (glutamine-hydrolysing)